MGRGAGKVAMPEHVAGTVHSRSLAVPHGENAVVTRPFEQVDLLAAPDGGGRQVFVDARLEMDMAVLEQAFRPPILLVHVAQR